VEVHLLDIERISVVLEVTGSNYDPFKAVTEKRGVVIDESGEADRLSG
jgi:hypothetical protein